MNKNKYTEEKILDKFKKIGYGVVLKENQTLILYNLTKARTVYITEDNSFAVGIGHPYFVGHFALTVRTTYTFEEKRLIKKLIKARKGKTNENN